MPNFGANMSFFKIFTIVTFILCSMFTYKTIGTVFSKKSKDFDPNKEFLENFT